MAFIIPDSILETLICHACSKYLSVKPVIVYPNRRVKCGRCARSKRQSDGAVSLYGAIAEKCLFKCVNRFDGCRELLTYSQVRNHEKVCASKVYQCPICVNNHEFPTFLLVKHFNDKHRECILDVPVLFLNIDKYSETSLVYFYRLEDNVFFLHLYVSRMEELIKVNVSYLGNSKAANDITQQITMTSEKNLFEYSSKIKSCSVFGKNNDFFSIKIKNDLNSVFIKFKLIFKNLQLISVPLSTGLNNSNNSIDFNLLGISSTVVSFKPAVQTPFSRKIFLSSNFQLTFPKISLSKCNFAIVESDIIYFLHCFNCQDICWRGLSRDSLILKFYFSKKFSHSICYYCFQMLKHENKVHENDYMISNFHRDMLKNIEFYCKWNCGQTFKADYHLGHEESCELQPLQHCPEQNCNFRGTIVEIASHMVAHPGKEICAYSNFYITGLFNRNMFVFTQNEFVRITILNDSGLNISIALCEYDNKNNSKKKPIALLFDDNKYFLMTFQNSITKTEANHWIKVILID
ncbi:unnamed protein product [Psylliodes chrysocephalus]|uniref:SIAH-type domain-containing protein n=1 Tax=Psylliodes chrysocephalus TaxID=3402493 RepID=A0A9P0CX15_9CUCU|nr:unnamed protein product [Psylliodes chrysocephala]